jgi:thiamine biosynthesis lipoprotein
MTAPSLRVVEHVAAAMDTAVSIQIADTTAIGETSLLARARHAFRWFAEVEAVCSRFDPDSELSQLSRAARTRTSALPVSPLLCELLQLALAVADASDGAFDPTLGAALQAHGFDRHWQTGARSAALPYRAGTTGNWRDLQLDVERHTITFARPVVLDLGGIAKGFAVDLAARDLADYPSLSINAGGDLFVRGRSPTGGPWRIGIRDPRRPGQLAATVAVSDAAVCTSGTDQRRQPGGTHHLLDPHTGQPVSHVASVTVLAPLAVLADALATAAFVLGPVRGLDLLDQEAVQGLCIDGDGAVHTTTTATYGAWTWTPTDSPASDRVTPRPTVHAPR